MTHRETILKETLPVFYREGFADITEATISQRLNIPPATFREFFVDLDDLVEQVVQYDLQVQVAEQEDLLRNSSNAVESVMLLLQNGIRQVNKVNPVYYQQLQQQYPAAWQIALDHLTSYSSPQLYGILNQGIVEGNFRRDINLELVTKIILEQVNMLVNPLLFPPDRYNLAEVFRSIFLYYLRGLCTDAGAKRAENFFAHNQL
jgi:AcrR family transcriptional regulator